MPSPTGSPRRTQTFSIRRRPLPTSLHTAKSRRTSTSVSAPNSRRSTLPLLSPASTATMSLLRTAPTTFLLALVMRTSLGLPPRPRLTSRHSAPLLLSLRAPRRIACSTTSESTLQPSSAPLKCYYLRLHLFLLFLGFMMGKGIFVHYQRMYTSSCGLPVNNASTLFAYLSA
ncbi:hypothetical protein CYLTODRAFT_211993 [Cylindrobasidium torrendii FP15055 ss-10]|uniref:Uncharacterized protein n=1 Tax=Cylindrobasidium torrendii FP15055 ss-10 TaxID=1314674 RepID=A0A0D7AUC6_9AGAR|nr:hypothetical protein CYLTODRAFT_211993 [Cylindrobasidium torrendii FP15055 ss-10]